MKHQRLKLNNFCSNEYPGLTSTFFKSKVKFCNLGYYMGNVTVMDSMEIIADFTWKWVYYCFI